MLRNILRRVVSIATRMTMRPVALKKQASCRIAVREDPRGLLLCAFRLV